MAGRARRAEDLPPRTVPAFSALPSRRLPLRVDDFAARRVEAEPSDDGSLARLAFDVTPDAPIGEPATVVLSVLDAAGAVRGERRIAVEVVAPSELVLGLPRPNPARGAVRIPYVLPSTGRVTVEVVDALGRRVLSLAGGEQAVGAHEAIVEAGALAAGVYAVVLRADLEERSQPQVRRLTVVR